jgi:hypothetical protein
MVIAYETTVGTSYMELNRQCPPGDYSRSIQPECGQRMTNYPTGSRHTTAQTSAQYGFSLLCPQLISQRIQPKIEVPMSARLPAASVMRLVK